ncbi:MAG: hypothetical protein WAW80_03995 [Candidatus Saccharimonadales bacterium]
MPSNPTNTAFMIPGNTDKQPRQNFNFGSNLTHEYANLQFKEVINNNFSTQDESRSIQISTQRNNLEAIFNPKPSAEQIAKMMEQISIYLTQEADLIESYRIKQLNGDA